MAKNNQFILDLADLPNQKQEYLETIFAISNGHFGVRAGHPLKTGTAYSGNPGSFINGFFESEPIVYGEWAYGYAKKHQTICKLPNVRGFDLVIGTEKSEAGDWEIKLVQVQLDMAQGVLSEQYLGSTPLGKRFELEIQSFASMVNQEAYCQKVTINNVNFSEEIQLFRNFKENNQNAIENHDPRVAQKVQQFQVQKDDDVFNLTTYHSDLSVAIQFVGETAYLVNPGESLELITLFGEINAKKSRFQNKEFQLSYEELLTEQRNYYRHFWNQSDVGILGNDQLQKGIRFNLFHLNQGAGRDGKTNYAAKALTGEGYEGHYFWDTEMYLLPFFIYTQPETAKKLLEYRLNILPQAKERAKELGQPGALFAWRTIDGQETSAYYPAGTAQVHINGDIVHAFSLYEKVTNDASFIELAKELIFETARFWLGFGDYLKRDGQLRFCINGVTGPDEYSALVNNNLYTNKVAQHNLQYAAQLAFRLGIHLTEAQEWEKAAEMMYFGYDQEKQVTCQDDSFLQQAIWPFAETPKENYPLLLHYHPMIIYKYQVCKQADTILAEMLFQQDFDKAQIQRDYQYYEKVTTHDSSLSRSIFSVMASRLGMNDKAFSYFMDTALMDLEDIQGNVIDGVHSANMGGSWLSLIYGFAGLNWLADGLVIENNLPKALDGMAFKLKISGETLAIKINREKIDCQVSGDSQLSIVQLDNNRVLIKK